MGEVRTDADGPLFGANVQIPELNRGTSTYDNGLFLFENLPEGELRIIISYLGYEPVDTLIAIPIPEPLLILLKPTAAYLDQVIIQVKGLDSDLTQQVPLSTTYLPRTRLQETPRLMGEPDVIRVIQKLPGVKAESDYSGGFVVRGGRNDQNLILLDGMPVYNPWHMFGLFGALNSDAVAGVEFNKGVFPVRYGGRVSSVMNVKMEDGRNVNLFDQLNIGLLSSSISMGGNLAEQTSVYVTTRRTYMDPFLGILDRHERQTDLSTGTLDQKTGYYFWDSNAKIRHAFNRDKVVDLNLFYGVDRFTWDVQEELFREDQFGANVRETRESERLSETKMGWENMAASLRWRHTTGRLEYSIQTYLTYFSSENSDSDSQYFEGIARSVTGSITSPSIRMRTEIDDYMLDKRFNQKVVDYGLKVNANLTITDDFNLTTGSEWVLHNFSRESQLFESMMEQVIVKLGSNPANTQQTTSIVDREFKEKINPSETAFYANLDIKTGPVHWFPGLRFERFGYDNGNYMTVLPRLNAGIELSDRWSIHGGYGHFRQYFQTVGFDLVQFPVENWVWADENVKPADVETWTLGTRIELRNLGFLTIEGYHRNFSNLADLDPLESYKALRSTSSLVPAYGDNITQGIGRASGIEFTFDWGTEKISAQFSYVLSRNRVQFDDINDGDWYPSRSDSPHDAGIQLFWKMSDKWLSGLDFSFKSGQPMTLALSSYDRENDPLNVGVSMRSSPLIMNKRNNYRLPDYHRLDLFLTLQNRNAFGALLDVTLSVINVYNRYNVFAINPTTDVRLNPGGPFIEVDPSYRYLSQLPLMPMLNFRFKRGGD